MKPQLPLKDVYVHKAVEKDAVRIPKDFETSVPFYYLRPEIEILSGAQDFKEAVARICFPKEELRIRGGHPRVP